MGPGRPSTGGATGGTLVGSTIPFPATREAREATGDPRLLAKERYATREAYLEQVRKAADALIQARYLLAEDLDEIISQAGQHYDLVSRPR